MASVVGDRKSGRTVSSSGSPKACVSHSTTMTSAWLVWWWEELSPTRCRVIPTPSRH